MKRILVINPNTSQPITDMVVAHCQKAFPGLRWEGVTASFGMSYIAGEVAYAIAGHAVLDSFARHFDGHDGVLIACFGDPGLLALRELSPVPVVGLAQASFIAAAGQGAFAVVTGGERWGPMLASFARTHQLDDKLVAIRTVTLTGAEIALDPDGAMDSLAQACQDTADAGAACVILGGAALAGMASALQARLGFPVFDNVLLGAGAVIDAVESMEARVEAGRVGVMRIGVGGVGEALIGMLGRD